MTAAARHRLADAARLYQTVRHLKPVQIYGRALKRLERVRPDPAPAPGLRARHGVWAAPTPRPPSLSGGWRVRFLNEDGEIARREQWNDPARSKLWLYNLHYFDDLGAADSDLRRPHQRALIERWIAENPPGLGNGWEPYPVSLRIVNWIKWALRGESLDQAMRDSLAMQARWLARHIEWHLLGNHLIANAKALIFAGLYFESAEAERWLAEGAAILARELPEQVLADGGHFELSPMYHAIVLEDVLDLINLSRLFSWQGAGVLRLPDVAQRMRGWLAAMTHPDGGPAFFNDTAFGVAASREEVEAYASRLGLGGVDEPGEGMHHLAASGYVRVNRGDMAAFLDLAPVGPGYIPGHAHADTLSFELSIGAERIVVNGGTSTYAPGAVREQERATAAHSTVEIGGASSSEVWASFRVARRAQVLEALVDAVGGSWRAAAAHDGYRRLPGRPVHRRTFHFESSGMRVADAVAGSGSHRCAARFHLHPQVLAVIDGNGASGRLDTPTGRSIRWRTSCRARIELGSWSPEFGRRVASTTLAVDLVEGRLTTLLDWD